MIRISYKYLIKELEDLSYIVINHGFRQLIPYNLNYLSDLINSKFRKIPIIKNLGLTEIIVIKNQNMSRIT